MKIIAGIDIKAGRVVSLCSHEEKIISDDPIAFCLDLKKKGVRKLHIVDLDGVFSGQSHMDPLLKKLINTVGLPIQFGGGIRNYDTAKRILDLGVEEIVIGTSAVTDQEMIIQLLEAYPEQVVVAADVYKGIVYTEGQEANTSTSLDDFLNTLSLIHVPQVIITDIANNGTLSGVDSEIIATVSRYPNLSITLSGGLKSDEEIARLKELKIKSVIITTALIENLITVE